MPKDDCFTSDTFYIFGWCSERELAFVSLTTLTGFRSNVIARGNHIWIEADVKMALRSGGTKQLPVTIDHTFDGNNGSDPNPGDSSSRHNRNAHSTSNLNGLKTFVVSSNAENRIDIQVVRYLENNFDLCRKD